MGIAWGKKMNSICFRTDKTYLYCCSIFHHRRVSNYYQQRTIGQTPDLQICVLVWQVKLSVIGSESNNKHNSIALIYLKAAKCFCICVISHSAFNYFWQIILDFSDFMQKSAYLDFGNKSTECLRITLMSPG